MIRFVNAKLNYGLNIVCRRPDGYHDLETIFLPVGLFNGTPENPEPFCDILEIVEVDSLPADNENVIDGFSFEFAGKRIDCPLEKNLVVKAALLFRKTADSRDPLILKDKYFNIRLEKHLPDGAGLGGGSADATFTLLMLNDLAGQVFSKDELIAIAAKLGADCPFFVENRPVYAEGIGEKMQPIDFDASGLWCVIAKPDLSISTKEAFAGVTPKMPAVNLLKFINEVSDGEIGSTEVVARTTNRVTNDFEASLFPNHPELPQLKEAMEKCGALHAQMSGSGASVYGIFPTRSEAEACMKQVEELCSPSYLTVCRL